MSRFRRADRDGWHRIISFLHGSFSLKPRWGLLLLLGTLFASPALAGQLPCGERATIVAKLAAKYGEELAGSGLAEGGPMLEIFASPKTGTWTVLSSGPDGRSCIVGIGTDWYTRPAGDPA